MITHPFIKIKVMESVFFMTSILKEQETERISEITKHPMSGKRKLWMSEKVYSKLNLLGPSAFAVNFLKVSVAMGFIRN